jgi:BirA family biotin operon repressor/biotin-[acetyl-CoA-carboxylase] ligase
MNETAAGTQLAWGTQALWQVLDPLLPGIAIDVLARTESTNSTLIERARLSSGQRDSAGSRIADVPDAAAAAAPQRGRRAMDTQPCLLVAEHQTRGRGRMGRTWHSTPGASLTFSLALPLAPVDWSGLSLAVGVALADALDPPRAEAPRRVMLKWPNDLWLRDATAPGGGRKLAGILIETVPVGGRRMCVVGVGLNIWPQEVADASTGVASLRELDPQATAPGALAAVAPGLVRALLAFERGGFGGFADRYAARDALAGRAVTTNLHEAREGIAEGVDERGALQLLCADGRRVQVTSGEVSVRPARSAEP